MDLSTHYCRNLAANLVDRRISLVTAFGAPAALAAKSVTTTIPIVFAIAPDPVQIGLVASLNHRQYGP